MYNGKFKSDMYIPLRYKYNIGILKSSKYINYIHFVKEIYDNFTFRIIDTISGVKLRDRK